MEMIVVVAIFIIGYLLLNAMMSLYFYITADRTPKPTPLMKQEWFTRSTHTDKRPDKADFIKAMDRASQIRELYYTDKRTVDFISDVLNISVESVCIILDLKGNKR